MECSQHGGTASDHERAAAEGKTSRETRKALERGRAQLSQESQQFQEQRSAFELEAKQLEAGLPAELLALYHRVADVRGGVAMAEVKDETCSECRVRVRPQVQAELRVSDQIFQCESCQRILYWVP